MSLVVQEPSVQPTPQQRLQQSVRAWVHFDNLANTFNKQAQNARTQKQIHEKEVQDILFAMNQSTAILEVNGARLQFQRKETKSSLSWSWLQEQLRAWFSSSESRGKSNEDLFKFLQGRRSTKISDTLERL
jgi:hypothetical protein